MREPRREKAMNASQARTATSSIAHQLHRNHLLLSIVPFISFFVLTCAGFYLAQRQIAGMISGSLETLKGEIESQMVRDGESLIRSQAAEVARQLEAFIAAHPGASLEALQRSPALYPIAVQRVGLTGYTCLYEAESALMLVHPNRELIDHDMRSLAAKLPSWWAVFEPSLAGIETSGYYQWLEEDGRITQKFMAITPVRTPVAGRTLMVAATTYMEEFLAPVRFTRGRAAQVSASYREFITRQVLMMAAVMAAVLAATLVAVFWLGRRFSRRFVLPIRELAAAAGGFGEDMSASAAPLKPLLERSDEIGNLAASFDRMRARIREQFESLQSSLAELRETQRALAESEAHYRSLFNNIPVGIYRTEPGGRILDANPALAAMFGFPDRESLLAVPATELYLDPADRAAFQEMACGRGKRPYLECRMRRRDGSVIWVENRGVAVTDGRGGVRYFEGTIKDVTASKSIREALERSERRFRTAFENAAVGMGLTGIDGRLLEANAALAAMLGYTPAELAGTDGADFTHPEDRAIRSQVFDDLLAGRIRWGSYERRLRHRDGSFVPTLVWASLERDADGRPLHFILIVQDISERKRAEENEKARQRLESQLALAQKMEAIGTLAGGIAHDFNNILSVIIGNTNILELSEGLAPGDRECLRRTLAACERARQLVKQILTFSLRGDQQRLLLNLKPLVKETFQFLQSALPSSIEVRQNILHSGGPIWADPTQIQQVLMNLCTNAAHAMESQESGVMEIRVEKVTAEGERDRFSPEADPGEYIKLTVRDSGPGIDPAIRDRIFDPYFTTKAPGKGTGLGLSVVHGIVRTAGGFIRVDSAPGRGAAFEVFFPLAGEETAAVAEAPPGEAERLPRGTETLLLVDDEKGLIDVTRQMLESLGYRVEARTSPVEALEAFRANPERFDAVVTDMTMPQMSGLSLARKLLEIRPELPVMLCTGFSDRTNEHKARAAGVREFAYKPLLLAELAAALRQMLAPPANPHPPE
jgi:PAS domain S-box-containing protein